MTASRPPPTTLGSGTQFALHITDSVLTVWLHHRDLGVHEAHWEELEQYAIDDSVEVSGEGLLVKEAEDIWYLVDRLEDVHLHGEYPKIEQ